MPENRATSPKLEILIPTFNHALYLDECFEALRQQTFEDFRVIVMDDVSPDETQDVMARWTCKDNRFSYIRNEERLGLTPSLIRLFSMASGPYVMLLCDDDLLGSDFLKVTVGALDADPSVAMAYTDWELFHDKNGRRVYLTFPVPRRPTGRYHELDLLIRSNWIPFPFGVFRLSAYHEIGGVDAEIVQVNDWELWLRMAARWPFHYTADVHAFAREHEQNFTKRMVENGQAARDYLRVYDKVFEDASMYPAEVRYLAKLWQVQRLVGRPISEVLDSLTHHGEPMFRTQFELLAPKLRRSIARSISLTWPTAPGEKDWAEQQLCRKACSAIILVNGPIEANELLATLANTAAGGVEEILIVGPVDISQLRSVPGALVRALSADDEFVRNLESPYVALISGNARLQQGWLEPLIQALEAEPESAAVSGRVLARDGRVLHAGLELVLDDRPEQRSRWRYRFLHQRGDHPDILHSEEVSGLPGPCVLIRTSALPIGLKGPPEEPFVPWTTALRGAGWRLLYEPKSQYGLHDERLLPLPPVSDANTGPADFSVTIDGIAMPGRYLPEKRSLGRKPRVLFVSERWCETLHPDYGETNSAHNLWNTLDASGLAERHHFFIDEHFLHHGERCDTAFLASCRTIVPDLIVLSPIIHEPQLLPRIGTIDAIRIELGVPVVALWFDSAWPHSMRLSNELDPIVDLHVALDSTRAYRALAVRPERFLCLWTPRDTVLFRDAGETRNFDVSFAGSVSQYPDRRAALDHLAASGIRVHVTGGQRQTTRLPPGDYAAVYQRSRITLNFPGAGDRTQCKGRVFEAMLCGAMLLEGRNPETEQWFDPMLDFVPFDDHRDLVDKVRHFVSHDEERAEVAARGHAKASRLYTGTTFWRAILNGTGVDIEAQTNGLTGC